MNLEPPPNDSSSFEKLYRRDADPWNFRSSPYERQRYRSVVEALPQLAYGTAFEPGCSIGELTVQLAEICGHVLAWDIAPSAVRRAQARCAHLENVEITCADLGATLPDRDFDLIVFSEVGYYFPRPELGRIATALAARLKTGGDFVAAHWLGDSADHALHGDVVHEELLARLPLRWLAGERHNGFRIDAWRCA